MRAMMMAVAPSFSSRSSRASDTAISPRRISRVLSWGGAERGKGRKERENERRTGHVRERKREREWYAYHTEVVDADAGLIELQ